MHPFRINPFEFLYETYPAKTRWMGLLYGENCVILTSVVSDWFTRVTDTVADPEGPRGHAPQTDDRLKKSCKSSRRRDSVSTLAMIL